MKISNSKTKKIAIMLSVLLLLTACGTSKDEKEEITTTQSQTEELQTEEKTEAEVEKVEEKTEEAEVEDNSTTDAEEAEITYAEDGTKLSNDS